MTVHCIFNGNKKKSASFLLFIAECRSLLTSNFILSETTSSMHASEIAEKVKEELILIIGGDGTVNEVLNGWVKNSSKPKLAIIPYGTGNDFVRGVKSNVDFDNFIESIKRPKMLMVDLPYIQFDSSLRYFVNICDLGFGGEVVLKLNKNRKKFGPAFSYTVSIIQAFLSFRKKELQLRSDNYEINGKSLMIAICNGPMFGDGLIVQPDANVQDGILHFAFFGKVSLYDYLKNLSKLKKGNKLKHNEVFYGADKSLNVTSQENIYGECDGELLYGKNFNIGMSSYKFPLIIGFLKN
jgi:diacylglycerol kinase (ATP)